MSSKQPSIDILLATYRGGVNFFEQLDSLSKQTFKNFNLIIRDDACERDLAPKIMALSGKFSGTVSLLDDQLGTLGALRNFSRLLEESKSDYVMFCDQDDVWTPTKIEKTFAVIVALEKEHGQGTPLLVHTDLKVVTSDLDVISESLWRYQNIHPRNREGFNRLLVQNVISGCTVMINKPLRDLALPVSEDAVMHDWWLALVASAFGKIGHVDQATMLYRQHESNEIGAKGWGIPFVVKNLLGRGGQVREGLLKTQGQARAFLDIYQDKLPDELKATVNCYAYIDQNTYIKKVYLLIRYRLFKVGLTRNIGLWTHI